MPANENKNVKKVRRAALNLILSIDAVSKLINMPNLLLIVQKSMHISFQSLNMKDKAITILGNTDTIIQQILTELRDVTLQNDRYRFRENIEKFGMIAGYELSKELEYVSISIDTPLASTTSRILSQQPIVATVLRAGIPLQAGVGNIFTQADLAYISAYRKEETKEKPEIVVEYLATPSLRDRVLIITDTMIATGESLLAVYESFIRHGRPLMTFIVSVIGSQYGVDKVMDNIPDCRLFIGAIDPDLNEHGFIVPGLGDAGDLSFGAKARL